MMSAVWKGTWEGSLFLTKALRKSLLTRWRLSLRHIIYQDLARFNLEYTSSQGTMSLTQPRGTAFHLCRRCQFNAGGGRVCAWDEHGRDRFTGFWPACRSACPALPTCPLAWITRRISRSPFEKPCSAAFVLCFHNIHFHIWLSVCMIMDFSFFFFLQFDYIFKLRIFIDSPSRYWAD